ncbi:transcript variant X1 [Nothobranchius furzeri]|uniref:Transcript variant X1 n=1 Tax=Nothobranchius furzeri TaxID=105023 RepID=A0A9D2YIG7_NOTFU|nr:zinc finger protein OZF isoform X1 [Nothobranchius furzeri]KAF7220753.1 transcript variant X1 [Nothobranchius furzeri]
MASWTRGPAALKSVMSVSTKDIVLPHNIQQMVLIKEEAPEEWSPDAEQQDSEPLYIKEEEEEVCTSLEGEQLGVKVETDANTTTHFKSEGDEEKPVLSQVHHHHIEVGSHPTRGSDDQMIAETGREDCGGAESSRNIDLKTHRDCSNSSETDVSEDDEEDEEVNCPDSQLKHYSDLGHTSEDGDNDWRTTNSDTNMVTKSLKCSKCDKLFVNNQSFLKHLTSHSKLRSSNGVIRNKNCSRRKTNVDSPGKIFVAQKSFSCENCGKRFTQNANLKRHMRVHTGEKPFSCDICGQRFTQKTNLVTHKRIHTGQKPFSCVLCGHRFSHEANLVTHKRIHTGQKPFTCVVCGQRFTQKTTLDKHIRIHTGEKPFGCDVCGQHFSLKANLKMHMRIHTGEKPFGCDLCGQRFTQNTNLVTHKRIHTGQKPFACVVCGQSFSHKTNLVTHKRIHTGEKPFTCVECGQRFTQKTTLNKHMQIHTEDKLNLTLFM